MEKGHLSIGDLYLEVTRRCNMQCEHCLRGNAQAVDMSRETVDKIFDLCDDISYITFTGGEPSLNLPLIDYVFKKCKEKWGFIPPFFLATNGMKNQVELASLLLRAYAYVDESEKECCSVALSVDTFHDMFYQVETNYLKGLSFYSNCKEHDLTKGVDTSTLLNMGRAKENGLAEENNPNRNQSLTPELQCSFYKDSVFVESLGVTALNEVVSECDYSYDMAAENRVCMLDELEEYLLKYAEEESD